jgi:uncharacterized protein
VGSAVQALAKHRVITPPKFVVDNLCYECLMGSNAYGTASDNSDQDIYGFCIPPKEILFPHLAGVIVGFGDQGQRFEQYQQPHIIDSSSGIEYDFTIYNIVKYFKLCADCNPNMIDSLFVPESCVKHSTQVGTLVRDNRKKFLSRRAWPRFKGYAYEQIKKLDNKQPTGKRLAIVAEHGYDTKFAYHICRLLSEVRQILTVGDIDLQQNNDELKAIRRGGWSEKRVHDHFDSQVPLLEEAMLKSDLHPSPDEESLKRLLFRCLEIHYGDLSKCVVVEDKYVRAVYDIEQIIDRLRIDTSESHTEEVAAAEDNLRGSEHSGTVPAPPRIPPLRPENDRVVRTVDAEG